MSVNKILNPGFGIGAAYGTPVTVALAPTATVTLTSAVSLNTYGGQFMATGIVAGTQLKAVSTDNGVTGTYSVLDGAPGFVVMDNTSFRLVNTTTSVNVTLIPLN